MPLHALTRWEFQQHKESHPWGSREPCGETTSKQGLLELKSGLCCRHWGNALAAEQTRTIGLGLLPWLRVWCFRPSKGLFLPAQDPRGEEPRRWLDLFKAQFVGIQRESLGVASTGHQAPVSC